MAEATHRKKTHRRRVLSRSAAQALRQLAAWIVIEGIGTFTLVALPTLVATAAALQTAIAGTPADSLAVAVSFGVVLAGLVTVLAGATGAHFNPAVTIASAVAGTISWVVAVFYIVAQVAGAILGSYFVQLIFIATPNAHMSGFGVTQPGENFGLVQVALVEFIGTAFLMAVISRVTDDDQKPVAPGIIGVALGGLVLCFGPVSGGAFNPARALGPMVTSGQWNLVAVYMIAPVIGAVVGLFAYTRLIARTSPPE